MKVIFVRHALAMDKKKFSGTGKPDSERPLTAKGLKDINRVGKILKKNIIERVDRIYTSPYLRAAETADILGKIYKKDIIKADFLCPEGNYNEMLSVIKKQPDNSIIMMVGHNPSICEHIGRLLAGKPIPFVCLDKSGVAIIKIDKSKTKIINTELKQVFEPDTLIKLYFS